MLYNASMKYNSNNKEYFKLIYKSIKTTTTVIELECLIKHNQMI